LTFLGTTANLIVVPTTIVTGRKSASIVPNWRRSAKRNGESSKDTEAVEMTLMRTASTSAIHRGITVATTRIRRSAIGAAPASANRQVMVMSRTMEAVSRSTAVARRNIVHMKGIVLTITRRVMMADSQGTGNNSKHQATDRNRAMDSRPLVMGSRKATVLINRPAMANEKVMEASKNLRMASSRTLDVNRGAMVVNNKLVTDNRKATAVMGRARCRAVSMKVKGGKTNMASVDASASRVETSIKDGSPVEWAISRDSIRVCGSSFDEV
jgi:hypothetical protein